MLTGAQLFTFRDYTQNKKDFAFSVKKVAEMGYTTVQLSAIGKNIPAEYLRQICDETGVKIVLTHSGINRILYDTDALIAEHDIFGCTYIGLGAMPEKYRSADWISHFADDFWDLQKKSQHPENCSCTITTALNLKSSDKNA